MCAAPCAAASGKGLASGISFQLARVAGYAAAGAVVAGSVGSLAALAQLMPAVRPFWVMLQASILALGLWMLWQGRQPAWMATLGRTPGAAAPPPAGWQAVRVPLRAAAAGSLWVAWPCSLLHSALLVASLAGSAAAGGVAMAAFALTSSGGLIVGPWAWSRLSRGGARVATERALVRAAGAMLVLGSGFALGHGVWHELAVACGWA